MNKKRDEPNNVLAFKDLTVADRIHLQMIGRGSLESRVADYKNQICSQQEKGIDYQCLPQAGGGMWQQVYGAYANPDLLETDT